MRRTLLFVIIITVSMGIPATAQNGDGASPDIQEGTIREASDFVVGLSALNNQLIAALSHLPTKRVVVLPFADFDGNYSNISNFFMEQMITAIIATRRYEILDNTELVNLIVNNGLSPMEFGKSEYFLQISRRYENVSIIAGSLTNLDRKVAVMARIVNGLNGDYAGGAMVYIRSEEEIAALLGREYRSRPVENVRETVDDPAIAEDNSDNAEIAEENAEEMTNPVVDENNATETPTVDPTEDPATEATEERTDTVRMNVRIPVPNVSGKNDEGIYRIAREHYEANRFPDAIGYFNKVVELFPESPLADNALYWIGESYYSMDDWDNAYQNFQKVLDSYPYGNKVPSATLKRGFAQEKLGRIDDAIVSMEEVISRFGDSDVAETARRKLQLLKAEKQRG